MNGLNLASIRDIAVERGHKTAYAVAKYSGISVSSAYRIFNDEAQPDLKSALRLAVAYDFDLRDHIDEDEEPAEEDDPAKVAA